MASPCGSLRPLENGPAGSTELLSYLECLAPWAVTREMLGATYVSECGTVGRMHAGTSNVGTVLVDGQWHYVSFRQVSGLFGVQKALA